MLLDGKREEVEQKSEESNVIVSKILNNSWSLPSNLLVRMSRHSMTENSMNLCIPVIFVGRYSKFHDIQCDEFPAPF